MKNGFTLIELLAVIVILAIIALIATPIVLSIINDTKESAVIRSAEFYVDAVENKIMQENMKLGGKLNPKECIVNLEGNVTCDGTPLEIEVNGDKPDSGSITFDRGRVTGITLTFGERKVVTNSNGELVLEDNSISEPKSFREDSWDTIAANVRAGNLSKYKVGDTKEITLTSDDTDIAGTYLVRIANTSTPSECAIEGFSQTACGFVIEFVDIISNYGMNSSDTSIGGWEASEMRSYVNNEIYNAFPEELRKLIIDTYVVSGHEKRKTENYKTTDKIYLLSTKEVWEDVEDNLIEADTARDVTRQLDYYKQKGETTDSYDEAIKKYNGNAYYWWPRSAISSSTYDFYSVYDNGNWDYNGVDYPYGVAVAFRL